jgi:hypothetical protein
MLLMEDDFQRAPIGRPSIDVLTMMSGHAEVSNETLDSVLMVFYTS